MLREFQHGALIALYTHALAVAIACFEIEIEGTAGWAANLPTWRRRSPLCGSRPLTGYHVTLTLTLILCFGCGGAVSATLFGSLSSLTLLCVSLATLPCTMLFEDAYWFLLNYRFQDALREGRARHHFQSASEQASLYVVCGAVGSLLWTVGYGGFFGWVPAAASLGFFWASSVMLYLVVVGAVRPVYIVVDRHLRNHPARRRPVAVKVPALLFVAASLAVATWAFAFSVRFWV